jgi:cell volume regulation protein A
MFSAGSLVGGSGYLAAFVAGLLFDGGAATRSVRRFFETVNDSLVKPVIFILLGGIAPLPSLIQVAWVGIGIALIFMFVIRPIVVFMSLLPWVVSGHRLFSIRELLFLSFIRETGVIPAVLILVAVSSNVIGAEYIFAIGMWVILLTLIIEPPLTPLLAKRIGITRE